VAPGGFLDSRQSWDLGEWRNTEERGLERDVEDPTKESAKGMQHNSVAEKRCEKNPLKASETGGKRRLIGSVGASGNEGDLQGERRRGFARESSKPALLKEDGEVGNYVHMGGEKSCMAHLQRTRDGECQEGTHR